MYTTHSHMSVLLSHAYVCMYITITLCEPQTFSYTFCIHSLSRIPNTYDVYSLSLICIYNTWHTLKSRHLFLVCCFPLSYQAWECTFRVFSLLLLLKVFLSFQLFRRFRLVVCWQRLSLLLTLFSSCLCCCVWNIQRSCISLLVSINLSALRYV